MESRGQSAAFDMILVLLSITIFTAAVGSFIDDRVLETEKTRIRNDYTHSLLVSMLRCTVSYSPEYGDKTISDLIAFYFQNASKINQTITDEITAYMSPYTVKHGIEWVFYGNETELLWIPPDKTLKGKGISSSSAEILLPEKKVRVYLFIKWD